MANEHIGFCRAISSGVERHVDIVEVGGSKPPSPTNTYRLAKVGRRWFDKLREQFGRPEGAPEG